MQWFDICQCKLGLILTCIFESSDSFPRQCDFDGTLFKCIFVLSSLSVE
jgi:hypothetical protein